MAPDVLFLSPGLFDKGGIARYGRYQLRALREGFGRGAVRAISLMGRADGDLEEPIEVTWSGSPVPSIASRVRMVAVVFREILRRRPGIVLTGHVNLGPLGNRVARRVGVPLVQTIYGREVWSDLKPSRVRALRAADRVIADCHNTAEVSVRLGFRPGKPDVIWDCVDLERFVPGPASVDVLRKYGIEKWTRFRILFLGRIMVHARYKGTERLLRLVSSLPADRFEAVFAGKGDDIPHLERLAASLGVADRVRFAGAIHEDHLSEVYRSADAFYLVSEVGAGRGEGLPLTPIEAMACGVPALVGNQDGSREIVDGRGGWKGSPDDLEGQAAYVSALGSDPTYMADERRGARLRVESAFGFERFARETCGVLEATLSGTSG